MASELTCTGTLSFAKGVVTSVGIGASSAQFDVSGTNYIRGTMSVPTTAGGTAIPLGSVATPGWFYCKNLDATNYLELMTAEGGTAFMKLKKGEFALGRFTTAAPAALANSSACVMEYMIVSD